MRSMTQMWKLSDGQLGDRMLLRSATSKIVLLGRCCYDMKRWSEHSGDMILGVVIWQNARGKVEALLELRVDDDELYATRGPVRLLASLRALDADVKYNSLQCTYHFHASGLDLEAVLDAVEEVVEDYGWRNRDHDICKDHPHEPYIVAYYVLNN